MKSDLRLVTSETDRQLGEFPMAPTRLLAALHEKHGRGWHIWQDGRKLLIRQMDVRWRVRLTLTIDQEQGIWYPRFSPDLDQAAQDDWMFWLTSLTDREWVRRTRAKQPVRRHPTQDGLVAAAYQPLTSEEAAVQFGSASVGELHDFLRRHLPDLELEKMTSTQYALVRCPPHLKTVVCEINLSTYRPWLNWRDVSPRTAPTRKLAREATAALKLFRHNYLEFPYPA